MKSYLKHTFLHQRKNKLNNIIERSAKGFVNPEEHVPTPSAEDLLFLPLGGCGEFGMNMSLYGTNKHWIMVDMGIKFCDDHLGINFETANLELLRNSHIDRHLKGVIITHAHEDHIGGVHEIWPYFKFHIYLTKFAKEVLIKKLENRPYKDELMDFYVHEIPLNGKFKLGDFDIQLLSITHSIPETSAILMKTKLGNILHITDWKIDMDPVLGPPLNVEKFKALKKENINSMLCDSTNALYKETLVTEKEISKKFNELFSDPQYSKNRIIIGCFASNIERIKSVSDAAKKSGKKVCLLGKSILRMIDVADRCKYKIHVEQFIDEEEAINLPKDQVVYVATGSQGDLNAVLARMGREVHKIKLEKGDTVFFSSKPIPGNERAISKMMSDLSRIGVNIVTSQQEAIHVSGHAYQKELEKMYEWVGPKCIIPIHGETHNLVEHAKFAEQCGYKALVPENGSLISLIRNQVVKRYDIGRWGLDGNRFIDMKSSIAIERGEMGAQGCVFISLMMDKSKKITRTEITINGLMDANQDSLIKRIREGINKRIHASTDSSDNAPLKTKSEAIMTVKLKERVIAVVRSAIGKFPCVIIHWINQN